MNLRVQNLGLLPYSEAYAQQQALHSLVRTGQQSPTLLLLEHPPVITLGKHAQESNILSRPEYLAAQGITLAQTDRGGDVTMHMPGQLVAYPIVPLQALGLGVREYVQALEEAVIATLSFFAIHAARRPGCPGIWLGEQKICAVGIRVKERTTLHGIALNVSNDLNLFNHIVPCGLQCLGVTSMATVLGGASPAFAEVARRFSQELGAALQLSLEVS